MMTKEEYLELAKKCGAVKFITGGNAPARNQITLMTDTQEAMRMSMERSLSEYREELERDTGLTLSDEQENTFRDGFMRCSAQSAEKIARLEADADERLVNTVRIVERDYQQRLAATELSNKQLREALDKAMTICDAVPNRAHELLDEPTLRYIGTLVNQSEGCLGYYAVILDALAQQPSTEALDAYVAEKSPAWQPIETAPKDEVIDLWHSEYGRMPEAWWTEDGWSPTGSAFGFTHWMPLPPAPEKE